jgi:hypothetical protein
MMLDEQGAVCYSGGSEIKRLGTGFADGHGVVIPWHNCISFGIKRRVHGQHTVRRASANGSQPPCTRRFARLAVERLGTI